VRDHHVVHAYANASARGEVVTQVTQTVREKNSFLVLVHSVTDIDEGAQRLLVEHLVDVLKGNTWRQNFTDEHSTNGRQNGLANLIALSVLFVQAHLDASV